MHALGVKHGISGFKGMSGRTAENSKRIVKTRKKNDAHVTQVVPAASAPTSTPVAHITEYLPSSHLSSSGDVIMSEAYVSQSHTEWKFDTGYNWMGTCEW